MALKIVKVPVSKKQQIYYLKSLVDLSKNLKITKF